MRETCAPCDARHHFGRRVRAERRCRSVPAPDFPFLKSNCSCRPETSDSPLANAPTNDGSFAPRGSVVRDERNGLLAAIRHYCTLTEPSNTHFRSASRFGIWDLGFGIFDFL